ncbi:HAD family hydrolase [Allohahella sp. A8]|uniref:HAD family hydrolase n=1 Tax=Allohahella sp. A8 TaxID=3141461 RepID=UPI000C0B87D3|nr:HAD family hydrolase [Hahellaceae bacterium]|tara:strand:- start:35783 stop:36493 length:711 start_codon:yes stop_codon:yes gene_type:complete
MTSAADFQNIRLLTFDLDNTLWDVWPVIDRANLAFRTWLESTHPELHPLYHDDAVQQARMAILDADPSLSRQPSLFRRRLMQQVLAPASLSPERLDEVTEAGFEVFFAERNRIDLFPFARELLESLSRQYEIIAISNGNADLERVGLKQYFKGHLIAEQTMKPKPEPYMFEEALRMAGVEAHEGLHIGDHAEEDVDAALAVGMKAIWFNPEGAPREDDVPVVKDLPTLHRLLDRST